MSRPFANNNAKPTFAEINKPQDAGSYILNKKIKFSFCKPNVCHPNKNIGSQSNYQNLIKANTLRFYPCLNSIDKTQLYINLITQLNLNEIDTPIISYLNGNTYPVDINTSLTTPFTTYNIDPSGVLFGNTTCGINNYINYMEYYPPYSTSNPGSISTL